MTDDGKIRLPSGQGGLTRYFDEYKTKVQLSPGGVVILCLIIIGIIIFLHYFGGRFLS